MLIIYFVIPYALLTNGFYPCRNQIINRNDGETAYQASIVYIYIYVNIVIYCT